MQKSVVITHKLYDSEETFNVPVFFEIHKEDNRTTYKCKVALTPDRMPEWLTVQNLVSPLFILRETRA
jgi:hypothetical protein